MQKACLKISDLQPLPPKECTTNTPPNTKTCEVEGKGGKKISQLVLVAYEGPGKPHARETRAEPSSTSDTSGEHNNTCNRRQKHTISITSDASALLLQVPTQR